MDICFKYCQYLLKGGKNTFREIKYINSGLKRVSNHLVKRCTQNDLKFSLSKIAYLCKIIKRKKKAKLQKDTDLKLVEGRKLKGKFSVLEGLKKTNPPAYFYWLLGWGE